ncbi:hypothetical protein GALMADRAFT_403030 [Galerina marginata CBS 339.88]|uniref:WSC domain-containing protein n=1 Tax=Galerina marginata (strain CBS 339.88) TaxID=685588 RepID=A0A067TSB7_GALM3|nr:hypothetical protein GALMADRAFT_403030 [Galerina marginata CBS 339.88]
MTFAIASFAILAALLPTALATPTSDLARRLAINGPLVGWSFVGCFTDNVPSSRTLLQKTTVNPSMTPALCTSFCQGGTTGVPLTGLNFAGVEFTSECYCDFNIEGTATKVNDTQCNFPCGGDSTFTCGGAGLVSVYQDLGHAGVLPKNKAKVGNWSFEACHTDAINGHGRTLLERFDIAAGVTIESCTTQCGATGFSIAGLEFGRECWCGNSFLVANTTAPAGDCTQACNADHTELCGAASRLSVYTKP